MGELSDPGFVEAGLPGSGGYQVGVVVVLGEVSGGVVPVHPLGGGDGDVG